MTYAYPATKRSCRRAQESFWKGFPGRVVWVTETGQKGERRCHNHALVKLQTGKADDNLVIGMGVRELCESLDMRWRYRYGISEFKQYDSRAGSVYLSKYLTKQAFDWDFSQEFNW